MPFVTDTFTDTAGTLIQNHVGETGATWTLGTGNVDFSTISDANRWRFGAESANASAYASGVPDTAEYDVAADFHVITVPAGNHFPGIAGRMSTSADTQYSVAYSAADGAWELSRADAGSWTLLGSYAQTLTAGVSYRVLLQIRDATKKVFIDGVERISSTDNTITAAGRAGIRGFSGISASNTTGIHLDNFDASDIGGGAPGVPSITAAGSAEDAVRAILSALPADADDVEIYGATTTGVDETDTLIGTLTAAGSVFWTERTPDTTYYLRPRATGAGGETFGDEVTAATFDDDFEASGVDDAEIVIPFVLEAGQTMTDITIRVGELIRATSGLGRTRSLAVVVTDGDEATIGSDTFTGSDITNVQDGEEHVIPLDPEPVGPQTITVTATVSIDPA